MGDNLHGQEGNNPDRQLRSQSFAKFLRKSNCCNSQDVGLEAATIEKVRNSLLVEQFGADNERE